MTQTLPTLEHSRSYEPVSAQLIIRRVSVHCADSSSNNDDDSQRVLLATSSDIDAEASAEALHRDCDHDHHRGSRASCRKHHHRTKSVAIKFNKPLYTIV